MIVDGINDKISYNDYVNEKVLKITTAILSHKSLNGIVSSIHQHVVAIDTQYGAIILQTNHKFIVNQNISIAITENINPEIRTLQLNIVGIKSIELQSHTLIFNIPMQSIGITIAQQDEIALDIIDMKHQYDVILLTANNDEIKAKITLIDYDSEAFQLIKNNSTNIYLINNNFKLTFKTQSPEALSDYNGSVRIDHYEINHTSQPIAPINYNNDIESNLLKTISLLLTQSVDFNILSMIQRLSYGWQCWYIPTSFAEEVVEMRLFNKKPLPDTQRLIFEIQRHPRQIIDCFFIKHGGVKKIEIVLRTENHLDDQFKAILMDVFYMTIKAIGVLGSLNFIMQNLEQLDSLMRHYNL